MAEPTTGHLYDAAAVCGCGTCKGGHGFLPHPEDCGRAKIIALALAERDEARAWVERMQQANVLTCVYCGMAYEPGTPAHGTQALTDHIKVCKKHPMQEVQTELRLELEHEIGMFIAEGGYGEATDEVLRELKRRVYEKGCVAHTNFQPTPEQINALPQGLQDYIHNLETMDPQGYVQRLMVAEQNIQGLTAMLAAAHCTTCSCGELQAKLDAVEAERAAQEKQYGKKTDG